MINASKLAGLHKILQTLKSDSPWLAHGIHMKAINIDKNKGGLSNGTGCFPL